MALHSQLSWLLPQANADISLPDFHEAKYHEQIGFSTVLGLAAAVMSVLLWSWDWAVDSAHAEQTLQYRLIMALAAFAYGMSGRLHLSRRVSLIALMLSAVVVELSLSAILNRLDDGVIHGNGGYLVILLMAPLITLPYSFAASALAITGLFLLPMATTSIGLPADLQFARYITLNGPNCAVSVFSAFVLDRLLRRNYLNREEIRRLNELSLNQSRLNYRSLFDGAIDGIFQVTRDGRFLAANPAFAQMLGYTTADALLANLPGGLHQVWPVPEELAGYRDSLDQAGFLRNYQCRLRRADGIVIWCEINARSMPMRDGEPECIEGFVTDITYRREAEDARNQALVAAENLARARSEFLANMSHEIRTPLNGVLGFAEIGLRKWQDPEATRNAFQKILTSGSHLRGLIDDILDFSKIEAGKLKIERVPMDLSKVVLDSLAPMRERAAAKHLELKVEISPSLPAGCLGDPLRLGQILMNLLSNAVKFTETGRVGLSVEPIDGKLRFRVSDTGIGMSEAEISRLFSAFQQADGSTTRRFGGTGLGLAICKRILELMDGQIRVFSRPGQGSTFEFDLPVVRETSPVDAGNSA
jgi:PAS domain S-box-containing protein